jgi:probable HAF family extracellular repeat protein
MDEFTLDHSKRLRLRREDGAAHGWALACKVVLTLSLALACQCALAQAMYRIKPLGYLDGCATALGAAGLNRADEVVGYACNAQGDSHAFLWKNDGAPMVDLGPNELGSFSYAIGINASGLVAGNGHDSTGYFAFVSSGNGTPMTRAYANGGASNIEAHGLNDVGQITGTAQTKGDLAAHAFLWSGDGSPWRDLGDPGGGGDSNGSAINASGQVAGNAYLSDLETLHAYIWKNDGTPPLDLGTLGSGSTGACCINASGQVAGSSTLQFQRRHAFLWRNDGTPMQDLGTLGGKASYAAGLNDSGQVAGYSYKYGFSNPHAFLWMNDGTPMRDLGNLGGTDGIFPSDINSSAQVTGWAYLPGNSVQHAFVWRNDGTKLQDLNTLIDPLDPLKSYVTLISGDFINDFGDIVADGTDSRTGMFDLYLLQGTVLTLTPRSLAFGNQSINTKSAAKSVTLTNTSPKVVAIASIALTGSGSSQFVSTNNCGSSLVGHATCTIKMTFKPTTKGAKTATLNVNGGGGGLRTVKLTGTGT